jgi:hypothetical protein
LVESVPIESFAESQFEFGVTPVVVVGTFLDLASSGEGGRFEFGATDIALTGVPIEYTQDFPPFELGVTPIVVVRIEANLSANPPATLDPPPIPPPETPVGSPLLPSAREFEPPRYAVTFERAMNGLSEAILWGNKPGQAKMTLSYKVIEDAWAEAWMKFYDASREVAPLDLPVEVYSGLPTGLANIYNLTKYGLRWFFVGPPKIESVKEGFSAIDIDFEGRNTSLLPYNAAGFLEPDPTVRPPTTDPGDPFVPLPDGDLVDREGLFWVSETTSAAVELWSGENNWVYAQTLVTAAGTIYWCGMAVDGSGVGGTLPGGAGRYRYFLAKYDEFGVPEWGKWLLGPYEPKFTSSTFRDLMICEGKNDGVMLMSSGETGGVWARVWSFTAGGVLDAYTQVRTSNPGGQPPGSAQGGIMYEPSVDKVYIAGAQSVGVLDGSNLTPSVVFRENADIGESYGRWLWLADVARPLYLRRNFDFPSLGYAGTGFLLQEFSADLTTRTQCYTFTYSSPGFTVRSCGLDSNGVLYTAAEENGRIYITKHGGSAAGFAVEWTRYIQGSFVSQGLFDPSIDISFLDDNRIVISVLVLDGAIMYALSADGATVEYTTTLSTTTDIPAVNDSGTRFSVGARMLFFARSDFSLVGTSLRLPVNEVSLATTNTGDKLRNTVLGRTNFTSFPLITSSAPTRNTISASMADLTPVTQPPDAGWTTEDLSTTVTTVLRTFD